MTSLASLASQVHSLCRPWRAPPSRTAAWSQSASCSAGERQQPRLRPALFPEAAARVGLSHWRFSRPGAEPPLRHQHRPQPAAATETVAERTTASCVCGCVLRRLCSAFSCCSVCRPCGTAGRGPCCLAAFGCSSAALWVGELRWVTSLRILSCAGLRHARRRWDCGRGGGCRRTRSQPVVICQASSSMLRPATRRIWRRGHAASSHVAAVDSGADGRSAHHAPGRRRWFGRGTKAGGAAPTYGRGEAADDQRGGSVLPQFEREGGIRGKRWCGERGGRSQRRRRRRWRRSSCRSSKRLMPVFHREASPHIVLLRADSGIIMTI